LSKKKTESKALMEEGKAERGVGLMVVSRAKTRQRRQT